MGAPGGTNAQAQTKSQLQSRRNSTRIEKGPQPSHKDGATAENVSQIGDQKQKANKRKEKHDQKFPNEAADVSTGGRKVENDKSDNTERKKDKHRKSGKEGDKPRSKDNDKSSHHRHHRKRHSNGTGAG